MSKLSQDILTAIKGTETNFTTGSINRAILMLSVPMILEMVMESLFALFDMIFVSQVSVEAMATVGLTESVMFLIYSLAMGLSMAATAMVARRVGEKDPEAASKAGAQAVLIAIGLALVIGTLGFTFSEDVLQLMGATPDVIGTGINYTRIMFGGNITIMLLFLFNGIFRGAGNPALAMRTLWLANGLNIVLDPCLIFGLGPFPELGVQGAAVATNIGRGVGVIYQLYHLLKGTGVIHLLGKYFTANWSIIVRLLQVAAGGAGQFLISSASWIVLMRIIATFGEGVVAGYTLAIRIIIFTILPVWGMANAASTLVGQNLGAQQPERAEKSVWKAARISMLFLLGVSIIFFIIAEPLIRLINDDPTVVHSGSLSLRVFCIGYVFFAYGMVISQAFNGAGDTRTPTLINLVCFWLLQVPLAYLLALQIGLGEVGVYSAAAISEAVMAAICIWWFRKGRWKKVVI